MAGDIGGSEMTGSVRNGLRRAVALATTGLVAGIGAGVVRALPAVAEGEVTVSVADATVVEPVKGNAKAAFVFSLNQPTDVPVAVRYRTTDGTATEPADYTKRASTVVIAPGATTATVKVTVRSDKVPEGEEQFGLELLSARNATLARTSAVAVIVDGGPTGISVRDAEIVESDAGSPNMVFTLELTRQPLSGKQVLVKFRTADLTAVAGEDYRAKSGTVRFPKNKNTVEVRVPVLGDTDAEGDEFFALELFDPVEAVLGTAIGTGHIIDND